MKKTLIATTVAALVAGGAIAQEVVTSVNIVGYQKQSFEKGKLYLVSSQFQSIDGSGLKADDVFGDQLPISTQVHHYDNFKAGGAGYVTDALSFLGWSDNIDFNGGIGFWVQIPDSAPNPSYEVAFLGEVPMQATYTNAYQTGVTMIAYPYTADVAFSNTALFASAATGDQIHYYDPDKNAGAGGYTTYALSFLGNWGSIDSGNLEVLPQGAGFWYQTGQAGSGQSFVEVRPYDP